MQELNGATPPSPTANLLTGLNVDEYFTRADSSGTMAFLADALGSTVGLANSAGAIATNYTYEPFGNVSASGAANANPYQFTGRENDATGLYFSRARYYSPTFQRFVSQDPIGFRGGDPNLYGYVFNNPTNWIDALGWAAGDRHYGLPPDFWNWYHRQIKKPGDPDLDKAGANWWHQQWLSEGQPDPEGHRTKNPGSNNLCPVNPSPAPGPWTPEQEHPPSIFPFPVNPGVSNVPGFGLPEPGMVPVPGLVF